MINIRFSIQPPAMIESDPAVRKWLSEYPEGGARFYILKGFLRWLSAEGPEPLRGLSPSGLIEYQRAANRNGNEYLILDAIQEYLRRKPGTYASLMCQYSVLRSFFSRNRAPLPRDDPRISPTREPAKGRLTVEIIRQLISNAPLALKPFYLTLWQGLLDQERFQYFNLRYGKALADHLRAKGPGEPFQMEFPGRKAMKNRMPFYTFIGHDALEAWAEYFDRLRGWPGEGEAAMLDGNGRPISKIALAYRHLRLLERLRYIRRGGSDPSRRYGYNLHEFRDVARTLLHLRGKRDGLDMDCVEFWMGHLVDPNRYDKFYMDREYVLRQYRIAERYLNILSGPQPVESAEGMIAEILRRREFVIALGKELRRYGFKIEWMGDGHE
ncbi:MAG: hypothetical protein QXG32_01910 [Candidatus Bathyarchaeia archaeon]